MTSFFYLSENIRAFCAFWALLLCLVNIGSAVLAAIRKRFLFTSLAVLLFAPCYFMWQVIFDLSLFFGTDKISPLSTLAGELPRIYWFTAFFVLTAAAVLLLIVNIRYDKTYITPATIKLYLDSIPCGICCWRENGKVLFSNICMQQLCKSITGKPLLNGNQLREAVSDGILAVDGKVRRFVCREITMDNERLCEMIASDITAEYAKTKALEKDKTELSRLKGELLEYYLSIDESVQRQEILQAKMNIHDEMNRLMLATMAADKDDTSALDDIFSLWERNALLLCMEAGIKTTEKKKDDVDSLADALGLELVWIGNMPDALSEHQAELFFFTAKEAVVNAVKHASAEKMEISFEETQDSLSCKFTNHGNIPSGKVRREGGLANIAMLAKKQGASLRAEADEEFTLVLTFEKNQPIG